MSQQQRYSINPPPRLSLGAILSLAFAIGSLVASWGLRWGWGLTLALIALPLGLIGVLQSVSPRWRGATLSLIAIALALLGVAYALFTLFTR